MVPSKNLNEEKNQVRDSDISYIVLPQRHVYLAAIVDLYSPLVRS